MTSQYTLNATKRDYFGKRASKRYRRDNMVPGEIYGSKENQSILINGFELSKQSKDPQFYSNVIDLSIDKSKVEVILKDVQRDPQKSYITHIDFLAVDKDKKIHVNVPFKFINEEICKGIKLSGGILSHIITEIEVNCLPKDIPENIEVDVAELDLNQSLHLTEITLPEGLELLHGGDKEHDTAIVKCYKPIEEVIEEPEVEGEAEGDAEVEGEEGAKASDTDTEESKETKETKEPKEETKKD
ncbi:MAG: 50S ribosomal protein L25/general stress protein Ctc [Gammaproteobacteria bacterium]|nr:50S ribosomal protein L25/general stress protein Ctc [Gammaproteobacteria bacterium]